jgi:periplasmic protein CpxP/Spy
MSKIMQNNKALILLVGILLLTNVGVLIYFLSFNKPHKPEPPRERKSVVDYVKDQIGFNDQQAAQFKQLHESHMDSLKILGEEIRNSKTAFFNLLQQEGVSDSTLRAAANRIGKNQEEFELNNFHHFQRIRALCADPQQEAKLDSMVMRMINRPFGRRGGPPHSDSGKSSDKH